MSLKLVKKKVIYNDTQTFLAEREMHEVKQYVTIDKRSKKAQKEYYSMQRHTWGELNPVTRTVPSGKVYNRKKEKRKIGVELRDGFDADFFYVYRGCF